MEVSGAVLRRAPLISPAGETPLSGRSAGTRSRVPMRPMGGGGFCDNGHLRYYVRCGDRKEEKKRKAKLVKGLSKDLSAFYSMGFGVGDGMVGDVKGKMMTEAAELLLSQLKGLRDEEKELKRKRKQEKKVMKMRGCAEDSSSSSDSECETVVKMKELRIADVTEAKHEIRKATTESPLELNSENCLLMSQLKGLRDVEKEMKRKRKQEKKAMTMRGCSDQDSSSSSSSDSECETVVKMKELRIADVTEAKHEIRKVTTESPLELKAENCCITTTSSSNGVLDSKGMDRIQVCMGGKCKKSGAPELMAEFEKMVGMEGAVVGCKCMGKCRDGPNVRVLSHSDQEEGNSVKASRNPLCIGVGLEDVGEIVSNFLGGNRDVELLAA